MKERKSIIKNLIPPIFLKIYRSKYLNGKYLSWQDAQKKSIGYNDDSILEKVKNALKKVQSGEKAYERDSVLFDEIEYSWPVLSALLWIATKNDNKLDLIDFGGSLGSTYFQNINFLKHLKELHWNIVEQKKFTDCGKINFQNNNLKFYYSLDECCQSNKPKVILLSAVLQYIEDPYKLIEKISDLQIDYIIIDRTPFHEKNKDLISVQKVPAEIYKASYPIWLFSRGKFTSLINKKYNIVTEFDSFDNLNLRGLDINYCGYILELKK